MAWENLSIGECTKYFVHGLNGKNAPKKNFQKVFCPAKSLRKCPPSSLFKIMHKKDKQGGDV